LAFSVDEIFFCADVGAAHGKADFQEVKEQRLDLVDVFTQFRLSLREGAYFVLPEKRGLKITYRDGVCSISILEFGDLRRSLGDRPYLRF
jgi:hypothetical protein